MAWPSLVFGSTSVSMSLLTSGYIIKQRLKTLSSCFTVILLHSVLLPSPHVWSQPNNTKWKIPEGSKARHAVWISGWSNALPHSILQCLPEDMSLPFVQHVHTVHPLVSGIRSPGCRVAGLYVQVILVLHNNSPEHRAWWCLWFAYAEEETASASKGLKGEIS